MINAISAGFGACACAVPVGHPAIPADVRIAAVKLMSGFASEPLDVLAMLFSPSGGRNRPWWLMLHMPR